MTPNTEPHRRFAPIAALAATLALLFSTLGFIAGPAHGAGNSGTIKIHAQDSPPGTESNEPHVCAFNIEAFGFDEGFDGYIEFDVQGGDGPTGVAAGPYVVGPADAAGYFATDYFNVAGGQIIQNGHYKVTLFGKFNDGRINYDDVKAKSKVFKVDCPPPPPPTPATPVGATAADVCEPATGPTNDRITISADANFTYTVDGTTVAAGPFAATGTTHTVNAVAKAGVVVQQGATTQWTFTFTKVLCVTPPPPPPPPPTPATPVGATAADVCEPATGPTNDRITIPADANFTYTVDGTTVAAGPFAATGTTHTVNAVAKAGVVVQQGATTQWTFTFTKRLCSEVLGVSAIRVKGTVTKIDKCGRAGDAFMAKRVKGVTYRVNGDAIRAGVWLKAKTRTVKVRAVASGTGHAVVGQDTWTLRFTNERCATPPQVLPDTGA
ncbi:hypothetical protein [Nocardioides alpinus]|nr:hypothetical protein [Nocardioides alpinus]